MYRLVLYANIARRLKELGISEVELARQAGVSLHLLARLSRGQGKPTLGELGALTKALQVPPHGLLCEPKDWADTGSRKSQFRQRPSEGLEP